MGARKPQPIENSTKIRKLVLSAALDVAADTPWEFVTMKQIADSAGLTLHDLNSQFLTKSDILRAIIDSLDRQVEKNIKDLQRDRDTPAPVRDRLFDVLMERIEIANQHRAAHISFFKSFGWTKESSCNDLSLLKSSMTRMAHCAGIRTDGLSGQLYLFGLSSTYLWVLLTWMTDTSPDLGRTMSKLDQTLGRGEFLADSIRQFLKPISPNENI